MQMKFGWVLQYVCFGLEKPSSCNKYEFYSWEYNTRTSLTDGKIIWECDLQSHSLFITQGL